MSSSSLRRRARSASKRSWPEASARVGVATAEGVFDHKRVRIVAEIGRADRHLAVTAGHVEHISRLGEPRETAAQRLHQCLAIRDGDTEMAGAAHQVGMMQVVRFYA